MKKIYVRIDGIHCNHCVTKITNELLKNNKIEKVEIKRNIATIFYHDVLTKEEMIQPIQKLDYFTKEEYISEDRKDVDFQIRWFEFILLSLSIGLVLFLIYKLFGFNILTFIPTIDNHIIYGMLVITGFLTSIHCIGMCGAIHLLAIRDDKKSPILYNLGRVSSYTILGSICGLVGSVIQWNETISGIILLLVSILMFLMSLQMLGLVTLPHFLKFKIRNKSKNSFLIGLLNGFMPCGPLQAMQLYALSLGSVTKGALAMFLFGIGTVPNMLLAGIFFNLFHDKKKVWIQKIASILILFLSFTMLNRSLLMLHVDLWQSKNYIKSSIQGDYQVVEFTLEYDHYENILVQKDIPVKIIIHASKHKLTGCNSEIIMDDFQIKQTLKEGENIIEFTPTKKGNYTYTCWMHMIKNNIKVVDNKQYFEEGNHEESHIKN